MTRYLLDDGIMTRLYAADPPAALLEWMAAQDDADLFISAPTIGAIFRAIHQMPVGSLKRTLLGWLKGDEHPAALFNGRVLPFDEGAARRWAQLAASWKGAGEPPVAEGLMAAAIALENDCVLVTEGDFSGVVAVVNPMREEGA